MKIKSCAFTAGLIVMLLGFAQIAVSPPRETAGLFLPGLTFLSGFAIVVLSLIVGRSSAAAAASSRGGDSGVITGSGDYYVEKTDADFRADREYDRLVDARNRARSDSDPTVRTDPTYLERYGR
jgi:hypothetical protein